MKKGYMHKTHLMDLKNKIDKQIMLKNGKRKILK